MGGKSVISNNTFLSSSSHNNGKFTARMRDMYDRLFMGVLYVMVHGNTFSKKFIALNVFVEFLQMISFCFRSVFPWEEGLAYLGTSLSFINLPKELFSYTTYTIIFWLVIVFVWLSLLNAAVVAYGFHNESARLIWPIRTLRWVTSALVTILYIPVVSVLTISVSCEHDPKLNKYMLNSFKDEHISCWGDSDTIVKGVFTIITLVVFSVFMFTNCLTYYESDPSEKSTFGRIHSRFEVIFLAVKTYWTLSFQFLFFSPWVLCVGIFVTVLLSLILSLVLMPYYNNRINQVRTAFIAVVLWASFSLIICLSINDKNNRAPTWLFVSGIIPAFVGGGFLYRKRSESFANIAATLLSPTSHASIGIARENSSKTTKVVRWNLRGGGSFAKALPDSVNASLHFCTDVEIMARFVLAQGQSEEYLQQVDMLYRAGLRKFSKSSLVLMSYIIFLMVYKKDRQRAFALLEKMRKYRPYFDVRFFIFKQDRERERQAQLEGMGDNDNFQDFVGYMQFKKVYNQARKSHLETLTLVRKFWSSLLNDHVDMAFLASQAGKIAITEEKAEKMYKQLLVLYPNSPRVLRDFAQFVDDILQEDELVHLLVDRADKLEETVSKSKSRTPRANGDTYDDDFAWESQTDFSEEFSSTSFQRQKERLLSKQGNSSLRLLSWVLIGTTIISLVLAAVMAALVTNQMDTYNRAMDELKCTAVVTQIGSDSTFQTRMTVAIAQLQQQDSVVQQMKTDYLFDLHRKANFMANTVQALLFGERDLTAFFSDHYKKIAGLWDTTMDIGTREFAYHEYSKDTKRITTDPAYLNVYFGNSVNVTMHSYSNRTLVSTTQTAWGLWPSVRYLTNAMKRIASYSDALLASSTLTTEYQWINANAPTTMTTALTSLFFLQASTAIKDLNSILIVAYVAYGVIVFVILCIAVLVFRPVVISIISQKLTTLNLFLLVPAEVVKKMANRVVKLQNWDEDHTKLEPFFSTADDPEEHQQEHVIQLHPLQHNSPQHSQQQQQQQNPQQQQEQHQNEVIMINLASGDNDDNNNNNNNDYNDTNNTNSNNMEHISLLKEREGETDSPNISPNVGPKNSRTSNSSSFSKGFLKLHVQYGIGLFFIIVCFTLFIVGCAEVVKELSPAIQQITAVSERGRIIGNIKSTACRYMFEPFSRNTSVPAMLRYVNQLPGVQQQCEQHLFFTPESIYKQQLMEELYGSGCMCHDKTNCLPDTDPMYPLVNSGLQNLMQRYIESASRLLHAKESGLLPGLANPDFSFILRASQYDLYDASDRAIYLMGLAWQSKLSFYKSLLGGIGGLMCIVFLLEYLLFFRNFMTQLNRESQNTLAMLQMIPKQDIKNSKEISDVLQMYDM